MPNTPHNRSVDFFADAIACRSKAEALASADRDADTPVHAVEISQLLAAGQLNAMLAEVSFKFERAAAYRDGWEHESTAREFTFKNIGEAREAGCTIEPYADEEYWPHLNGEPLRRHRNVVPNNEYARAVGNRPVEDALYGWP